MKIENGIGKGRATMLWTANTPCGFQWKQVGDIRRAFRDFDGIALIYVPKTKNAFGNT